MDDSFWLTSRARRIEDKERILCLHRFCWTDRGRILHRFVPFHIFLRIVLIRYFCMLKNYNFFDRRACLQSFINRCFHGDNFCSSKGSIGRDNQFTTGILNSVRKCLRRKSAENNRVNRAHSRTSKYRNNRLENHRHIDTYSIPFFDAILFENIGELTDLTKEFLISDFFCSVRRCIWLPIKSYIIGLRWQMSVKAVFGNVEFSPFKPANIWSREVPCENRVPWFFPSEFFRLFFPKAFRIFEGRLIFCVILCDGGDTSHNGSISFLEKKQRLFF